MRKYILTEGQMDFLVNRVIIKNQMIMESHRILNLRDLAEILARTETADEDMMFELVRDVYKDEGDEGIIKLFQDHVGIEITDLSHGRYIIK